MIKNGFYSVETQGRFDLFDVGNLVLQGGETLRGCRLAYRTQGVLNAAKSNAVLVTTWFSGTAKSMEDVYVGAGHALDPARYFIIIADQIGGGVSSSAHNTAPPQAMGKFPRLAIGDDVTAQHKLITEHFGIEQLALVVGGSMGGQAWAEWQKWWPPRAGRQSFIKTSGGTRSSACLRQMISSTG